MEPLGLIIQQNGAVSMADQAEPPAPTVRRPSLKKSRAFENLSGMSTSSSEDSLACAVGRTRIRTFSEPNYNYSDANNDDETGCVKKTRSDTRILEAAMIDNFSMMGFGNSKGICGDDSRHSSTDSGNGLFFD